MPLEMKTGHLPFIKEEKKYFVVATGCFRQSVQDMNSVFGRFEFSIWSVSRQKLYIEYLKSTYSVG